jgi:UDPglucose 6-dehydrogenase
MIKDKNGQKLFHGQFKIGIVGYGWVGKAMHQIFGDWVEAIYDPFVAIHGVENSKKAVNKCDLAIVCVMTKENKDWSCDTSIVEESIKWLEAPVILIKSAIPPGTTDYLKKKYKKRIVVSPEYFGESRYFLPERFRDPRAWPFQIFGGDIKDTDYCVSVFKPIFHPKTFFYQIDAKTAELIKYAENIWGATKVTWANEFFEICKVFGVSYNVLREGWALDPRVEKNHTSVFERARGFGGKCFPKDLKALIKICHDKGYRPKFLEEVWRSNMRFRRLNKQKEF